MIGISQCAHWAVSLPSLFCHPCCSQNPHSVHFALQPKVYDLFCPFSTDVRCLGKTSTDCVHDTVPFAMCQLHTRARKLTSDLSIPSKGPAATRSHVAST